MSEASSPNEQSIWENEVLTVPEVAVYLRVSRVTVWRWCRQEIIPATRVGRNWRIRRKDLLHLLEAPPSPDSESDDPSPQVDHEPQSEPVISEPSSMSDHANDGIVRESDPRN